MTTNSRTPAGQTTGGQLATQNRDEATVELAGSEDTPTCRTCGSTDDVDDADGRCDVCSDTGNEECIECYRTYNEDGDGHDGMCGDCADQAEGPWCSKCGERMRLNDDGTSVHLDDDGDPQRGVDDPGHPAVSDSGRTYIGR